MSGWWIGAGLMLAAVFGVGGGLFWASRRGEAKGRAEAESRQQAGTIDAAGKANAAGAAVRDTPKDIADDPFNRDRR